FGQWDPKNQRPEIWNLYNARLNQGENMRVLIWMLQNLENPKGEQHVAGISPRYEDIDWRGLALPAEQFARLSQVDAGEWRKELSLQAGLFDQLGASMPLALRAIHRRWEEGLGA
ncbi:MAG: phosphoenolpyruvate carboxykinase (GTP), partial [Betaproteobacteria bacterium]|nr:phosphoenolpyruvate carboxykinase (GTP) [Betaproteobacteria bacterium]